MAQIPYRANLSAAIFPMTLARAGRSVIVPQADQNFDRRVDPQGEQKSAGIPQIIYGENILPTADGYQSVGYKEVLGNLPISGGKLFDLMVKVPLAGTSQEINLQISAVGIANDYSGVWQNSIFVGPWIYGGGDVTTATVNGVCYLYTGTLLYSVDIFAGTVRFTDISATVTPGGFLTDKVSMCGSYNYLIFASRDTVFWSSTTTPTDFVPSLVSGSGSGRINATAGNLKYLRATAFGFLGFCESNAVAGTYTGNNRYPFRFTPVNNSGGVGAPDSITGRNTDTYGFLLTNRGTLQQLSGTSAELLGPEVSELLERIRYADVFDSVSNTFTVEAKTAILDNTFKLTYLNNRFLVLSCYLAPLGIPYTQAIVYDSYLNRYGKLNIEHTSIIERPTTANNLHTLVAVNSITGKSYQIVLDIHDTSAPHEGVLVLGKFQYARSRFLCLDEVSIESAQLPSLVAPVNRNFSVLAIPTLDGKTFQAAQPLYEVTDSSTGAVMSYNSTAEGRNVSLLIKGAFDLTSVEMMFHLGGDC